MSRKNTSRTLITADTTRPRITGTAMRWFLLNSKEVSVTYELRKSAGLTLVDNGFFVGGTLIDLAGDQQSDQLFKSASPYPCTSIGGTLLVELQADGLSGDGWELEILVDGKELDEFPITENVNSGGRADHNKEHLFRT